MEIFNILTTIDEFNDKINLISTEFMNSNTKQQNICFLIKNHKKIFSIIKDMNDTREKLFKNHDNISLTLYDAAMQELKNKSIKTIELLADMSAKTMKMLLVKQIVLTQEKKFNDPGFLVEVLDGQDTKYYIEKMDRISDLLNNKSDIEICSIIE